MASNDIVAPNPSKMELLRAKRKEAKSVPESRPYRIRDALDESAPTKPKARPELKKPEGADRPRQSRRCSVPVAHRVGRRSIHALRVPESP